MWEETWVTPFKAILSDMFFRTPTEPWLIINDYGRVVLHCTKCPAVFVLDNESKDRVIEHRKSHEFTFPKITRFRPHISMFGKRRKDMFRKDAA